VRETARRGNLPHGTLNNVINDVSRSTTLETYQGIAQALDVSMIQVLEVAGVIPTMPLSVPGEQECLDIYRRLSEGQREAVKNFMRTFAGEREALSYTERETQRISRVIGELPDPERELVEALIKRLHTEVVDGQPTQQMAGAGA
jgi:hypothetical protein